MKKQNAGATTMVVVCAMAIIMTLSLSLFATASVLMKTAGQSLALQQCRILAVSFSEEIEKQLTARETVYSDYNQEASAKLADAHTMSLWHYVKEQITTGTWPYYEEGSTELHGKENAFRTFTMDPTGVAGEIAETKLTLYWTRGEKESLPKELVVKTTVTVKEQSCTVTDIYELQIAGEGYEAWKWKHILKK